MMMGIGCTPITGRIYVGPKRTLKDGTSMWTGKRTDVTDEAIGAVVYHFDYLYRGFGKKDPIILKGEFPDGTKYKLTYTESKEEKE